MKVATLVSAGGVILDERGWVVTTARRSFKGDLQWGLPKGLVEEGESIEAAALREAREETGFEVEAVRKVTTIDYWYVQPPRDAEPAVQVHKFVHYFLMRITGGDPAGHDHETEQVDLLAPGQAIERMSFSSEARVVREALQ